MEYLEGKLVEIYTSSSDTFNVGKLVLNTKEYLTFIGINAQGLQDGIYVIRKDFLSDLQYDTDYLRKLLVYTEYWNRKNKCSNTPSRVSFHEILQADTQSHEVVDIICNDDFENILTGRVLNLSEKNIT